jgi:hypothetical protein
MWQNLRNRFYGLMYRFGKAPPGPAEITAHFDRLEQDKPMSAGDTLCDCQVLAGGKTVDCQPGRRTYECEAIGDLYPGLIGVPHEPGSCKNLPGWRSP